MEENIEKVERGYINDDFLHDRESLRITFGSGYVTALKMYRDGRIVNFNDERWTSGEYTESDCTQEFTEKVKQHL